MEDDAILLAVAVHDDREARLEDVDHGRIQVKAHAPATLRVSYRFADSSKSREAAVLKVVLKVDGERLGEQEAAMYDRPLLDDEQSGDLRFETPPLHPGLHVVDYTVHLEVSDETIAPHHKHTGAARTLQGQIELDAVE